MKEKFLKKLSECGVEMDSFISKFMDIKMNIGNGVGAGKLFESLFSEFVNQKMDDIYSLHLNLSNSTFIWDLIITDDKDCNNKLQLVIDAIKSGIDIEKNISNILGDNWIGTSLKTYKDDSCQITTDYSYRTYLESKFSSGEIIGNNIDEFFSMLNKHDKDRYTIIALNTYDRKSSHVETINREIENLEKLNEKLIQLKRKFGFSSIYNLLDVKDKRSKKTLENLTNKIKDKNLLIENLESQTNSIKNQYSFRLLSFDKKFDKVKFKKIKNYPNMIYQLMVLIILRFYMGKIKLIHSNVVYGHTIVNQLNISKK